MMTLDNLPTRHRLYARGYAKGHAECKAMFESNGKALRKASENLGKWMAAALDDPKVCTEMKADINAWFAEWSDRGEP
jgi:hypothetical protein